MFNGNALKQELFQGNIVKMQYYQVFTGVAYLFCGACCREETNYRFYF